MEDGAVAFDLAQSKYSISGERNKCVLHLWSSERDVVRRVIEAEMKNEVLRLEVQRLGQAHPSKLEICRERDRRTPTAKRAARLAYSRTFQRMLEKKFRGYTVAKLTTAMDLERSFGPVYTRGLLRQGQSAIAVLGVNGEETQASVDAALTFGILWLDSCRQEQAGKVVVEGLSLFVPPGTSSLVRERMSQLHREAAKWRLYEFDEREDRLKEIDVSDRGNIATRLVHWTDERAVRERFADSIAYVGSLMGAVDERLYASCLYSQVPAFSASDRAMIDVLTVTREGRLAVVELKADEDIHLPLQGLDYWSRVAWHQARGEFQRFGYFPGKELSTEEPLLFLVSSALHVHPATDTLLHYISLGVQWTLVGIDERWRKEVKVVVRKRARGI